MSEHVVWLDDPGCHLVDVAGGKGSSLGRMREAGMPVPPAFVVTASALTDSLRRRGALAELEELTSRFESGADAATAAGRMQKIVMATTPSETLDAEISAAYRELGEDVFVAVRSSACAEDGDAASFAGQQETFLNVVGSAAVTEKIVECWASFFSERALFYRQNKGSLADLGMAVVVQRQIASDKSGVMFTTDPVRQRNDQMVIEAAYGLGEALVSGLITPDNYVTRRDGRLKRSRVARQDRMIVRDPEGGTLTVDLDEDMAVARVLDDTEIARLAEIGVQLESAFGSPQDIEWAFEGEELFVLQSRPITT
ncbi:MAG: PEP/pyruvate-binding domain-containing protein [Acidimicrobiia bacterium]